MSAALAEAQVTAPTFALQPEDGKWTSPKDFAGSRYSGLEDINTDTVKNLRVALTFSTGVNRARR